MTMAATDREGATEGPPSGGTTSAAASASAAVPDSLSNLAPGTSAMQGGRSNERKRAAPSLALLAALAVYIFVLFGPEDGVYDDPASTHRQLSPSPNRSLASASDPAAGVNLDPRADPHELRRYAYLIITYHKSGHALSHALAKNIDALFKERFGGRLSTHRGGAKAGYNRSVGHGAAGYNAVLKCGESSLAPGSITVVGAPELGRCKRDQLARTLLNDPDPSREKRGVKIIHLVRDPYRWALSNYFFHAQDPTPEPFVHTADPCRSVREKGGSLAEASLKGSLGLGRVPRSTVSSQDFSNIARDCASLYRTKPGLTRATYYEHLLALNPKEGIRLAAADKFNNVALIASNAAALDRVRTSIKEKNAKLSRSRRELELLTMPLDEWIHDPNQSMHHFLDFVFGDHLAKGKKDIVATGYERTYRKTMESSNHVTTGKRPGEEELVRWLREDEAFGGAFERVRRLLKETVRKEGQGR
ncbi:hypothetical protein ACHAWF_003430 [Thalassiosira exigua]